MEQTKNDREQNNQASRADQQFQTDKNQVNLQENQRTQTPPSRLAGANQPEHPQYLTDENDH